ncbi:hypothetical protein Tco_1534456, partial [Tanacetum coccineum]
AQIKQLKKKARPVINHHKAWFRAPMLKKQQKKKDMEKPKKRRSVSKQGRKAIKSSKGAPSVQTNTDWDDLDSNLEDYTLAQDDTLVVEDKGSAKKGGSTKGTDLQQSTVKPDEGTDKQNGGTDRAKVSTDSFVKGTAEIKDQVSGESDTPTVPTMTSAPTPIVFGDDETIAQVLVTMSKGMIEEEDESNTESEDITEAEKKLKMLANDEEMARKARLNAYKILAEKLQEEEREKFTIEERAKLLHDTIAAQRRFLAQ